MNALKHYCAMTYMEACGSKINSKTCSATSNNICESKSKG
jgi:hypothetical protein